jgi:Peptidase family M1 domain
MPINFLYSRRAWFCQIILVGWTFIGQVCAGDAPSWVADVRAAVAVELAANALPLKHVQPAVDVTSTYDPANGRMQGSMRVGFHNDGTEPWSEVGFVLHANNSRSYVGTGITITVARVEGLVVEPRLVADGRGVLLPLSKPLPPGAWATCELEFTTTIPEEGGRAGLLTRSAHGHHLYSWLPELAIRREGWDFPALVAYSDPSFVRAADYRWRLTLPDGWTLVASGLESRQSDGAWLVLSPRTRNLVAWVSNQPVEVMRVTPPNGPEVRVAFIGKHTVRAAFCASVARDALIIASEMFGAYPRRSYDIVFATFALQIGGMEASGMTFLHEPLFAKLNWRGKDPLTDQGNALLHATIHEVLHSWWYDQVGNDTHNEPWLDEPLTEWSTWYVMERLRSKDTMQMLVGTRLPAMLAIANDLAPLNSAGDRMSETQFGVLLYCRGPLMYAALREEVGDEALFAALRTWYHDNSGSVVNRADWERTILSLLPKERRAAFLESWVTGINDPIPATMDQVLKNGHAPTIREQVANERTKTQPISDKSPDSAPSTTEPVVP